METTESLTRAAMDTLPSHVAVLDEEGTILFTNGSWREFADTEGAWEWPDMHGVNYFDSIDPGADEHAVAAAGGLRSVLAGERDEFELEYPCHSADQKRWFLMRARRFALGGRSFATVAHVDITDRRLAEIEATENAEQAERERRSLERLVEHINGVLREVTKLLVESVTREGMETGVCDRLIAADPYVFAWIGAADLAQEVLEPRAWAGGDRSPAERPLADASADPSVRALLDREVRIVDDPDAGGEARIAIPLIARETAYGVLTVHADRADAFDDREQVTLRALGRILANAINALESRQALTANRIVEIELSIGDDDLLYNRLSAAAGCTLAFSGSVHESESSLTVFFTTTGSDPERVFAAAEDEDAVEDLQLLATVDDDSRFRATVADSLLPTLAERGAVTQELVSERGIARVTVELAKEADARSVFELVSGRYEGTELAGYHEHERPVRTRGEFRSELADRLTDRQRTALRTAYHSGFFDWPRGADGDELASAMGISRSTFHQHLRVAERKILEAFFEGR